MIADIVCAVDRHLQIRHQRFYDRMLDGRGLLVGSYRTALICAFYGLDVMGFLLIRGEGFAATAVYVLIIATGLWLLFVRNHLEVENQLQEKGRYAPLNAAALERQGARGLGSRLAFIAVLVPLIFLFNDDTGLRLQRLASLGLLMSWTYALGVTVRERDEARFRQPRTVFGGA